MNEKTVKRWIFKAENDLKIAKDELNTELPATDMVCFHAQQCAEKYLKSFLIFHNIPLKRTHDLALLIEECALIEPEFRKLRKTSVDELSDYAVGVRYGDEFLFPSIQEAREAIELAEFIKDFVLKVFEKLGIKLDPERILKEVRDELSQE